MSQAIPASTPSPVSPAVAAPQAAFSQDMGSTAYPQWVAQTSTPAVASATTAQAPSPAQLATVPSTNSQSSQFPSASSPSNPWEAALGSLDRIVSRLSPSPSQTASLAQPQAVAPDIQQSNLGLQVQQPWAFQPPTAQPTLSNSAYTTQISSPTSTAPEPQLSQASAAVVNHFGLEAPAILNQYSTTLEDALIQQHQTLEQIATRGMAMEQILTDPDHLADYTNRFFTEVYPTDLRTDEQIAVDEARAAMQQQSYQPNYDQVPAVPAAATGGQPQQDPNMQWEQFGQVMNQAPDQAWRYLNNMSPEALRAKLLFLDQP